MKSISTLLLIVLCTQTNFAQNKKYIQAMESNISKLYEAKVAEDFDPIANTFDRIGQAEKEQWEPAYYAALSYTFKAFRIKELPAKDAVLDQALAALLAASEISDNNPEILALEGFINMIKIGVDPATRGRTLSPRIMALYSQALQTDPDNPRAMLFKGQMLYGSAQFFGSSLEEPCALVYKSITLFESETPTSTLAPAWGKASALQYQEQCQVALTQVTTE